MTRSITIVNTSNWDGEDYLIGIPGQENQVRMRPGESVCFTPAQVIMEGERLSPTCQPVELDAVEGGTPTPFEQDTVEVFEGGKWPKVSWRKRKQVFPKVRVTIE